MGEIPTPTKRPSSIGKAICGYCEIEFPKQGRGRPPKFCSNGCRHADFDERTHGRLTERAKTPRERYFRKLWRRVEAEMTLNGLDRWAARDAAREACGDPPD